MHAILKTITILRRMPCGQDRNLKVVPSIPAVAVKKGAAVAPRPNDIITLESASSDQLSLVAECFGRSMTNDPTMNYITGGKHPDRTTIFFRKVARMALNAATDRSTCWVLQPAATQRPSGGPDDTTATISRAEVTEPQVICIAYEYPRSYPGDWEFLRGGLLDTALAAPSLRVVGAFLGLFAAFAEAKERFTKEHGPFLYICCFGTAPEHQGKGLGAQLLREALAHARKLGVPTYLEASGADSCRFYQKHGFSVLGEVRAEPGSPPLFLMACFPAGQGPLS